MGFSGLSIKKFVNTNSDASSIQIFSGLSKGIVLISNNGSLDGRYDALIFVANANTIRVNRFNEGHESPYQSYSMSNGVLSVSNTGYGVGAFTAYYLG